MSGLGYSRHVRHPASHLAAVLVWLSCAGALASCPRTAWAAPPAPGALRSAGPLAGFRATDWAAAIDSTWGPSPLTIPEMLQLFDGFWTAIDDSFACFQDLDVDWNALNARYRPEIAGGVSRGRLAAIMNHLALALKESHTAIWDQAVNDSTPVTAGTPLMYFDGWGDQSHFGAALTPLPDSTLLVYRAVSPHPLGLVPGDIVLGYEGIPWKRLYQEVLDAQLPLKRFPGGRTGRGRWWGSAESAYTHTWLISAGMNWHLFSTIDIVKYGTQDTLHLPVAPLQDQTTWLFASEQLPVPGVPSPDPQEDNWTEWDWVSWGIVEGTQIGYIYVRRWGDDAGTEFYEAVEALMTHYDTEGLIIDFRLNGGGNIRLAYPALERLYNTTELTIGLDRRCVPVDHQAMCPVGAPPFWAIYGDPSAGYDRPIAVLVGPGALSSGDQGANLMRFHPMVRFFGKSTAAAFNSPVDYSPGFPGWTAQYAAADAYLASNPGHYLTRDEFPVDEAVWLTPDDVAQGHDTVVRAAVNWIRGPGAEGLGPSGVVAAAQNATDSNDAVQVRWVNAGSYDSLHVYRDGTILARLPGASSEYNDQANRGLYKYEVSAVVAGAETPRGGVYEFAGLIHCHAEDDFEAGNANLWIREESQPGSRWDVVSGFSEAGAFSFTDSPPYGTPYRGDPRGSSPAADVNAIAVFGVPANLPAGSVLNYDQICITEAAFDFCIVEISKDAGLRWTELARFDMSADPGWNDGVADATDWRPASLDLGAYAGEQVLIRFRLQSDQAIEFDGWYVDNVRINDESCRVTATAEGEPSPAVFALYQNHDAFSPTTTIEFALPEPAVVSLKVYDVAGRAVAVLGDKKSYDAGHHGVIFDRAGLRSGMYFYRLQAGPYVSAKKMLFVR